MTAIDLNTYGAELQEAVNSLVSTESIDWVVFGYEGQGSTLKVLDKGNDGLEEMNEAFSCNKICYGYARVKDPNTALSKYVFINWQGESAPEKMKAWCVNHTRDVQRFCKTIHVRVNARNEDDLDVESILKQVSSASGANYSVHKEKESGAPNPAGKVGSVYQRVNAQAAIPTAEREAYWASVEKEEAERKAADAARIAQERRLQEAAIKRREKESAAAREAFEHQRQNQIAAQRELEKQSGAANGRTEQERLRWEKEQAETLREEDERRRRAESLRKERALEAQRLIARRNSEAEAPAPVSQRRCSRDASYQISSTEREAYWARVEQEEKERKETEAARLKEERCAQDAANRRREAESAAAREQFERQRVTQIAAQRRQENQVGNHSTSEDAARREWERQQEEAAREEQERQRRAESLRKARALEAQQLVQQGRNTTTASDVSSSKDEKKVNKILPESNLDATTVSSMSDVVNENPSQDDWDESDEIYENSAAVQYVEKDLTEKNVPHDSASKPTRNARALYDYIAGYATGEYCPEGAEDEISFDPDEIITDVDFVDDGWWVGTNAAGHRGMFPSNYVELC